MREAGSGNILEETRTPQVSLTLSNVYNSEMQEQTMANAGVSNGIFISSLSSPAEINPSGQSPHWITIASQESQPVGGER